MSPHSELALLSATHEQHELARGICAQGIIEPARRKIWCDHGVAEKDFLPLVTYNPIVPAGREQLWARALYAGLSGDFVQVAHIAIPQIEHAIRSLLNRRGVITTSLGGDGLQEENSLGTLFEKPELAEILGVDRIFDMKSLLTERGGANLRNKVAHGLMPHDELYSLPVSYLWWLTLHLCFLPTIAEMAAAAAGADNGSTSGD
jgi:hypothetical protein